MAFFSSINARIGKYLDTVDNLSALRSYDVSHVKNGDSVLASSRSVIGDALGGAYVWSAISTDLDDNENVVRPSQVSLTSKGRWLKMFGQGEDGQIGPVGPRGATGDVTPAALAAVQSAGQFATMADAARQAVAGVKEAVEAAAASKPFAIAVGTGEATFDTIGVAKLASIPASVTVITTKGYYSPRRWRRRNLQARQ